jgi:hypothetical protein
MALRPWPEARAAAARTLRVARAARDSMSPREAALAAHTPGGPSVEALETLIRRHRAEALAAQQRVAATPDMTEPARIRQDTARAPRKGIPLKHITRPVVTG